MDKRIVVAIDGWDVDSMYPSGHYVRTLGTIGDRDTETVRRLGWRVGGCEGDGGRTPGHYVRTLDTIGHRDTETVRGGRDCIELGAYPLNRVLLGCL